MGLATTTQSLTMAQDFVSAESRGNAQSSANSTIDTQDLLASAEYELAQAAYSTDDRKVSAQPVVDSDLL